MRSILDELTRELLELKALVESIEPVNDVLSGHQDSLARQYVSVRRRFDNAAFIVALYASFENFVENLVAAYIGIESRRLPYLELPQKLLEKHLQRSAELLWRGRIGEGRYASLSEMGVVKNLFDCLSGSSPYSLNETAIVAHDSNLRANEVDELFAAVGIQQICDHVRRTNALGKWYKVSNGFDEAASVEVNRGVIEERLKDIVERRNQVAHRGGSPEDLLGVGAMRDALGFIEGLSQAIFNVVVGRYLRSHYIGSDLCTELVQREGDGPYRNGTIVVIESPTHRLFIDQAVFVITESTSARWGRIQSLQIDDQSVEAIESNVVAPQGIGVGLNFKCPKATKLFALLLDDDLVWSSLAAA